LYSQNGVQSLKMFNTDKVSWVRTRLGRVRLG
jgi:hypothetical protein